MYPHSNGGPAELVFRYGAMNSGKSTDILNTAYNYEERGMSVRIIKPAIDTKGSGEVVSRSGLRRPVDLLCSPTDDLFAYVNRERREEAALSSVLVDEVQFLEPDQIDQLLRVTVELDIPVFCYGLRSDFRTRAFPASIRLFEVATVMEERRTICRCGSKAVFNGRLVNGHFVAEGSQVAIDGEGEVTYESLCHQCYCQKVGMLQLA
jgi:thymidine kinase